MLSIRKQNLDFSNAAESWQKVLKASGVSNADRLVANRHINDIANAAKEESDLKDEANAARNGGLRNVRSGEPRRSAAGAVRYEMIGDWGQALASWQQIVREFNQDAETPDAIRPFIILAKRKAHEIRSKLPEGTNADEEKKIRLAALDTELAKATVESKDFPLTAVYRCRDILDLYAKDKDPEVVKRLAQFQKLLETLPRPRKG